METLRRIRFVWSVTCLLAAAVCAFVGVVGNPTVPAAWYWFTSALCAAFAPYMSKPINILATLWLGVVAFGTGAMVNVKPFTVVVGPAFTALVGGLIVLSVLGWVLTPLFKQKNRSPERP